MIDNLFFSFLDERKALVLSDIKSLAQEGRIDESNVLKAKSNVYDICKAVYNAAAKQSKDTIGTAFPATFNKITSPWKASLEQAKLHNDARKILIEEAKLEAVSEINAKFAELVQNKEV